MTGELRRVGVNLCWLVPGVVGGSEESTLRTLRAVPEVAPGLELVLFGLAPLTVAHPDLAERFEVVTLALRGRVKPLRVLAEQAWLTAGTRDRRLDMVHHAGGTAPGRFDGPTLLTIHDLQPLDLAGHFHPVKVEWLRRAIPRSIARSTRIAVPSAFVADTVVDRFGVDRSDIDVVPHGVAPVPVSTAEVDDVRSIYRLPARYLVLPAITYPHKGHVVAIEAMSGLPDDVALVLPGGRGPHESAVASAIAASPAASRIRRLGRVPEADLRALVAGAQALVWPSTYEGFGLPLIEAMAAGCPVVAVRAGATPEVVADAGLLVTPGSASDLAAHVSRLLTDGPLRDELVARGRRRAGDHSAAASARHLVAAYRSTVAAH